MTVASVALDVVRAFYSYYVASVSGHTVHMSITISLIPVGNTVLATYWSHPSNTNHTYYIVPLGLQQLLSLPLCVCVCVCVQ